MSLSQIYAIFLLQSNLNVENLEHYHGTGAFNTTIFPTWDSVLLEVLSKPKQSVEVTRKSRRAGGGGGWRGQIGGWNAPKEEVRQNPNLKEVSGCDRARVNLRITSAHPALSSVPVARL